MYLYDVFTFLSLDKEKWLRPLHPISFYDGEQNIYVNPLKFMQFFSLFMYKTQLRW